MSFLSSVEAIFETTEADVVAIIAKVKQGAAVAEAEIAAALKWIAANAPSIMADIQTVVSLVEQAGILTPSVQASINAANVAVAALNVFAANVKAGNSNAQAVVAGYVAAKQAAAAASTAAAVAATAAAPAKAA